MATITAKAYIPSAGEYDALKEKFPAFASADVSEKAKEQGAWVNDDNYKGNGYYFLRTPLSGSSNSVYYGYKDGVRGWNYAYSNYAGLRVALPLIYNPESSLVRGCRKVKRTTKVWDEKKNERVNVTSTAPVVNYGGNDYIWTNREACENGTSKVMSLISLDLIEKAVPFDREGNHNDYAKAEELRAQCEKVAFENASEEEKAMAVEATMSSEDDYESVKYNLEKEDEKVENSEVKRVRANIDTLFAKLTKEEIQVRQWKDELNNIIDDMGEDEEHFSEEDILKIGDYITTKFEQYKKRMSAKEKSKSIVSSIADDIGGGIENE